MKEENLPAAKTIIQELNMFRSDLKMWSDASIGRVDLRDANDKYAGCSGTLPEAVFSKLQKMMVDYLQKEIKTLEKQLKSL